MIQHNRIKLFQTYNINR